MNSFAILWQNQNFALNRSKSENIHWLSNQLILKNEIQLYEYIDISIYLYKYMCI